MITQTITLSTKYGNRKVDAMQSFDGSIKIYTEREIPTPDNQPLQEWFNDIMSIGYDLEDVRGTTVFGGTVVITGYREAEDWEVEQLKSFFPDAGEE